jgi:hypothetical protein
MGSMTSRVAAINFGENLTYRIDHLIPLCDLLKAPLFVGDQDSIKDLNDFYPKNYLVYLRQQDALKTLAQYDLIITSDKNSARELGLLIKHLFGKRIRFLYLPHGNSDKGQYKRSMDQFLYQDISCIYGSQMLQRLTAQGIINRLNGFVTIGNIRKDYYLAYKSFFDSKIAHLFHKDIKKKTTILYAPSWDDDERRCSYQAISQNLIKFLPDDWYLIIKIHPLFEKFSPGKVALLMEKTKSMENMTVLFDMPLIYPLLQQCDLYLGDYSSIGYDYLWFDRPMYFVDPSNRNKTCESKYLYRCGIEIPKEGWNNPYPFIMENLENNLQLSRVRKKVYQYAFEQKIQPEEIKQMIFTNSWK